MSLQCAWFPKDATGSANTKSAARKTTRGAFGARGVEHPDLYIHVLKYLEAISYIFGHGIGGIIMISDSSGSNWVKWVSLVAVVLVGHSIQLSKAFKRAIIWYRCACPICPEKLPTSVGSSVCGCMVRCQDIQAASRLDVRSRDRCEVAVLAATLPEATAPNQSRSISELASPRMANHMRYIEICQLGSCRNI